MSSNAAGWTSSSAELRASLKTSFGGSVQLQQQQKRAVACVPPMT